jgi:hypothetical protein
MREVTQITVSPSELNGCAIIASSAGRFSTFWSNVFTDLVAESLQVIVSQRMFNHLVFYGFSWSFTCNPCANLECQIDTATDRRHLIGKAQ